MPPSEETKIEMTGTPVKPARTPSASTNLSVEQQQEPPVDAAIISEEDKLDRINFLDVFSPQMQAFHLAWISFMAAFIAWFSIAPLMPVIKKALHLKKQQIMYANLASVSTTIVARIAFGPLCDRFGPKRTMAAVLLLGSIPVFCVGQVHTWQQLVAIRAAIGFLGASFVMSQAWASNMFRFNIVGTANAIVGGWGNLGGGVTQPMMADIYQDLLDSGLTKDQAWRRSFYVPAVLLVVVAAAVYFLGQDTPKGDIKDLRRKQAEAGVAPVSTAKASMWLALSQLPTYILAIQYAASFGVELTVFNMAATYFHETYKISVVRAGNIALLSGITNIFARAMGGFLSDFACRELGMRGRLVMQWLLVLFEGILLVWFSHAPNFHMSTALLLAFSIFVQAANGSCFAIVPYVSPYKGSVSGIVGAGGNIGAMVFSLLFIFGKFASTAQGYRLMGWAVLVASFTIFFIRASDLKEYGKQQQKRLVDATVHDEEEGVAKAVHFDRI